MLLLHLQAVDQLDILPVPSVQRFLATGLLWCMSWRFVVVSRHWQKLVDLTHELLNVPAPPERATLPCNRCRLVRDLYRPLFAAESYSAA